MGAEVPGVQVPWQIARQPGNTAIDDPFDCLPIKMPLKSKELFHYCKSSSQLGLQLLIT